MGEIMKQDQLDKDTDEEEDIYGEDSRERLVDEDELTPEEAGFMQGYMDS